MSVQDAPKEAKRQVLYTYLLLFTVYLFAFLGYLNTLNGEFVFDDVSTIEDNLTIKDFSFFRTLGVADYLNNAIQGNRPLTYFTFAVNYAAGRFDPFGYHVFNFIVHLANILLLYILVYKTLSLPASPYREQAIWISFLTVIFFGLHPIQTGAVSYISQRAEILGSFFYLLALLFFIRGLSDNSLKSNISYLGGIICFFLGLGSKEIIITLPFVLSAYWFYFLKDQPGRRLQLTKLGIVVLPVMVGIFYRIHTIINDTTLRIGFKLQFGPYEYFLTQTRVIAKYIGLLILPINQNSDYDFAISHGFLDPPSTLPSLILLLLLLSAVVLLFKRWKIGSFALVWFFLILAPTSSFIPLIDVIFEHRVYLASAGFFLLFSLGLYHASKIVNIPQKKYLIILTVAVLLFSLTYITTKRNMVWTSRIAYWEDVVHKSPLKARGYLNLGSAYQERGERDLAVAAYQKATSLAEVKEKPNSMLALALCYAEMGKKEEALSEMKKALVLDPINSPDLQYLVGTVYEKAGLIDEAVKSYKEAINKNSRFVLARYALAVLYERKKSYDDAIMQYKNIIKIDPGSVKTVKTYNKIGVLYAKKGAMDEAKNYFLSALKIDPLFSPAIDNLKTIERLRGGKNE